MPIYDAKSIPAEVNSSTRDREVAAFLETGPVLGAHKPIHEQRVEHNAFIDKIKPPIGKIEHLVLDGPHGSLPVRVYHSSKPGPAEGGALVYVHGGGFMAKRMGAKTIELKSSHLALISHPDAITNLILEALAV
jgi:hypothetical protein